MKKLILDIYDGHMVKKIREMGYREVSFDVPPNIACIRMSALLKFPFDKQKERVKEINDFMSNTKKYRLVLEEVKES